MANWADADDVVTITGRTATPESIAAAQVMIEIFSGAAPTASDQDLISGRNLGYLRRAVAFQAVWLDAHPDVLETMDVQGVSQDGLSAQYAHANAHLLAPMAHRCVTRLSWRTAPLRARARRATPSERGDRDSAVRDDQYEWDPL
jgi:hypothetical protein